MSKEAVTVIGLGPMGQAMVRAFLAAGHPTTVWNRTAAKADAMAAEGAIKVETATDAVAANELIVLSLTHYDAMYAILEPIADHLNGKTIVNLSSDTPERARRAADWAAKHGARFLVGGVLSQGPQIGHESSYILYSGPREVLDAHRSTLEVLCRADYRGEDPGLGQLYYQSILAMFVTSMVSFEQAVAMMSRSGVDSKTFLPYAQDMLSRMPEFLAWDADLIQSGQAVDPEAALDMMAAGIGHIIGTGEDAGVDMSTLRAFRALYERAIAAPRTAGKPVGVYDILIGADSDPA